jgi:hypothetical protein
MRRFHWLVLITLSLFLGGALTAAQTQSAAPSSAAPPVAPCELPGAPAMKQPADENSGPSTMSPKSSIKDIMNSMMMPAAAGVWNAVATVTDASGVHEYRPQTDDDWNAVIASATMLVETPNVLMVPGRQRCLGGAIPAAYRADFNRKARELQEAANIALIAAKKHDADALGDAGERIDVDCDECHEKYQIAAGDPDNFRKVLGTYKLTAEEKAAADAARAAEAKAAPKAPAAPKPAAPPKK